MEYLMTYGWAILIIAVVLGALYALGVFNAVNFMPKVPGGGCHVFRPNGPGTSWNINLVGSCNNALPQYVAQFNGQSDITINALSSKITNSQISLVGWFYIPSTSKIYSGGFGFRNNLDTDFYINRFTNSGPEFRFRGSSGIAYSVYPSGKTNVWEQVALTYNGTTLTGYVDGSGASVSANSFILNSTVTFNIGENGAYFNGSIANVQIYNTSLTANQVQYLYNEGIGGVPISPQYLVGWWPLNGDANDYSGNNNNGAATAITFNGTWTGGYNVP